MRMVLASTSRRKPATMNGTRTSTATGIATARIHWGIDTSPQRRAAYRPDVRHHTPIAAAVHIFDSEQVAGTDTDTGNTVFGTQRCKHLNDLAIDLRRHETVAVRIKTGGRPHLILDTALERERGSRRESHEEVPHRPDEQLLEEQ